MNTLTKVGQTLGAAGIAVAVIFAVNGNAEETVIVIPNDGDPETYVVEFKTQVVTSERVTIQELESQVALIDKQQAELFATRAILMEKISKAQEAIDEI